MIKSELLFLILTAVFLTNGCAHRHYLPIQEDTMFSAAQPFKSYARILSTYVTNDGRVDFSTLKKNSQDLDEYVQRLSLINSASHPQLYNNRDTQLAFYINAYNALCMYNVIYSGVLPKNRVRFFVSQKFKIDGKFMSLLDFENKVIRSFNEPRIHFAINCMSRSCPRLRNEPFRGEILDAQLQDAAIEFFNDPRHTTIDHQNQTVHYSKILKWFKKDFLAAFPSLTHYVNQYRHDKIPEHYKVKFLNNVKS